MRNVINFCIPFVFILYYCTVIEMLLFANYCVVPPKSCPNYNISFYLYTRKTQKNPMRLDVTDPRTIETAFLIPGAPLKIIIHGYTGNKTYTPNMELRPAYFRNPREVNIITVDYGQLALDGCYLQAIQNMDLVAMCTAQFLDVFFEIRQDVAVRDMHVVAFSLGCHIAGQIKNYFQHGVIERITGMDPAAPFLYEPFISDDKILNKGDAKFVDAIHTNCGFKGKCIPRADVDFYANNVSTQPGCGQNNSCSHARAVEFYAESINSPIGFWASLCTPCTTLLRSCNDNSPNWNLFGEYTNLKACGIYYFITNDHPSYALGFTGNE